MGFDVKDLHHTATGDVTGFLSGSQQVILGKDATWSGSRGQAAYTVGDIVGALKDIGVLAVE